MTLEEFGKIVSGVMENLPPAFRPYLDNVTVDVEDEPDRRTLQSLGFTREEIRAGESLYGLFAPMELPRPWSGDVVASGDVPHRLVIYRKPLEADFPDPGCLAVEIRKTVVHELAHHFGYTDRDLEKFDNNPDPFRDRADRFGGDRSVRGRPTPPRRSGPARKRGP